MDFKTFFKKKILMSFFISTTCICAAMATIGTYYEPNSRFGYEALFYPIFWGALAVLPQLATYSPKELTLQQALIRKFIHLFLLEALIMFALYSFGALTSLSITIALAFSVLLIYITVNLVLWMNDNATARDFNKKLKAFQSNVQTGRIKK